MESSPLHPSLLDQCLSSPSPTTPFAHHNTRCFSNDFPQPHHQLTSNASIQNMARKSCKRRKKSDDDGEENRKRMRNCKGELGESRGYIHVRARRGEAADSHSLAERVRREKISEKMKTLQAIVPGCDKITGKAHMLDQVINYVHSLQNEVQILSLKLASVNPMLYELEADFDAFMHESHQNTSNYQEQLLLFPEHQMPCIISQNNPEILLDSGDHRRQEQLDDPFAILNSFNSF